MGKTRRKKYEIHFESNFHFLKAHNGLRRGKTHIILGSTHGGKSTLVRSVIADLLERSMAMNVLVYLSEESLEALGAELCESKIDPLHLHRLKVISELDMSSREKEDTLQHLEEWVKEIRPSVFIVDNITTAQFYNDKPVDEQHRIVSELKKLSADHNFALVLVAHTRGEVIDGTRTLISANHIRGSKSIANLAEFFYAVNLIQIGSVKTQTLNILKHRLYDLKDTFFIFRYDNERRLYSSDRAASFKEFKELLKNANRL